MSVPVKKVVKVIQAQYVQEADAILLIGECGEGRIRHQIHSSAFKFGARNKEEEMEKLAHLLVGKKINIVFDPDLNDKIKEHYPLKY